MPSSIKAVGNIERSLSTTNFEFPKPCLIFRPDRLRHADAQASRESIGCQGGGV